MKRLILITDHYPYTRGELPFVQPELAVTCQHFEVSVICKSPAEKPEYPLPPGVKLYHYHKDATMGEKIRNLFGCLLDGNYYRSVFGREHAKGSWRAREAEVRNFRLSAHLFRKYLRDEGFFDRIEHTIYYSYWYNYGAMALALEKQRHPRMRIITRTHGYDLYNERSPAGVQPYKRFMDRHMDAVFFVSRRACAYYKKHFATQDNGHYQLAYLGVPDNGLNPPGKGEEISLFSCSNVIPIKRVDLLVEALSLLPGRKIRWVHAGGGSQEEAVRRLAEEKLGGNPEVSYAFLGAVPNEEVIAYYKSTHVDLFLTASETEGGTPVSIMEAFSFGVPAVGTDVGGIPEMINAGTGFLLSANPTPQEIAAAIAAYADAPAAKKTALRSNARQMWHASFYDKANHTRFASELEKL